jgi:hypothetical protein
MQNSKITIDMLTNLDDYWDGFTKKVLFIENADSTMDGNYRVYKLHALQIFGNDEPDKNYQSIKTLGIGIFRKCFDDKEFKFTSQIDFYMGLYEFMSIYEIPPPNPTYQIISRGASSGIEFALAYVLESDIDFSHGQF